MVPEYEIDELRFTLCFSFTLSLFVFLKFSQ